MAMFTAAYLVAWTAVAVYVLWLAARQRRLDRAIAALERHLEAPAEEPVARSGPSPGRPRLDEPVNYA